MIRTILCSFGFVGVSTFLCAEPVYDAHYNAVTGSSEVIGLGGAYRAEVKSISTSPLNPAGLSWMRGWWDANFSFGSFDQTLKGLPDGIRSKSSRIRYFDAGLSFKKKEWKDFGFGLYFTSPFASEITGEDAESNTGSLEDVGYEFSYVTLGIPLSLKWDEHWSTGVAFKISNAQTKFSTTDDSGESNAFDVTFDLGVIYKPDDRSSYALVYHFGQSLGFTEAINTNIDDFQPFREAKTPHRLFFGYSRKLHRQFKVFFDWGIVFPLSSAIRPGTGISDNIEGVESGESFNFPYHVGLKYLVFPGIFEAKVGHYWQPSRASGEPQRFHGTLGLDYFFWYIKIGAGIDAANDFLNFSFSISPSFSHRERRKKKSFL